MGEGHPGDTTLSAASGDRDDRDRRAFPGARLLRPKSREDAPPSVHSSPAPTPDPGNAPMRRRKSRYGPPERGLAPRKWEFWAHHPEPTDSPCPTNIRPGRLDRDGQIPLFGGCGLDVFAGSCQHFQRCHALPRPRRGTPAKNLLSHRKLRAKGDIVASRRKSRLFATTQRRSNKRP
jgi:hypothetical protein